MASPRPGDSDSDDEDLCPICMGGLDNVIARPEVCQHIFHRKCICEWAKCKNSCPVCREEFKNVFIYEVGEDKKKVLRETDVYEKPEVDVLANEGGYNRYDFTLCTVCGGGDREDCILICDECDQGFHTTCLDPPLSSVPSDEHWYCTGCTASRPPASPEPAPSTRPEPRRRRLIRRTALSQRVSRMIRMSFTEGSDSDDSSCTDEDEDEQDFDDQDRATLEGDDLSIGMNDLPSVSRGRKKTKKRTTKKRRSGSKKSRKRKSKRRSGSSKRSKRSKSEKEKDRTEPGPSAERLSITGSGMDYSIENEEPNQASSITEPVKTDECDLLGSIIPEQEKTLAPGKLFKVQDGKFNPTDDFNEYQKKVQKKMESRKSEPPKPADIPKPPPMNGNNTSESSTSAPLARPPSAIDEEVAYEMDKMQREHEELEAQIERENYEMHMKAEAERRWAAREKEMLDRRRKADEVREKEARRREQDKREANRRQRHEVERREREREERRNQERREKGDARVEKSGERDRSRSESRRNGTDDRNKSKSSRAEEAASSRDKSKRDEKSSKSHDRTSMTQADIGNSSVLDESAMRKNESVMDHMVQLQMMALNDLGMVNGFAQPEQPSLQNLFLPHHLPLLGGLNGLHGFPGMPPVPALNPNLEMLIAQINAQHQAGAAQAIMEQARQTLAAQVQAVSQAPPIMPKVQPVPAPALPKATPQKQITHKAQPPKKEKESAPSTSKDPRRSSHRHMSKDERVNLVDQHAKKVMKGFHAAGTITTEEYKELMRTVVKDCVKRGTTHKEEIREFARGAVEKKMAMRNAQQ